MNKHPINQVNFITDSIMNVFSNLYPHKIVDCRHRDPLDDKRNKRQTQRKNKNLEKVCEK